MRLWTEPALAEEAVFERVRALEDHAEADAWQRAREGLYTQPPERRAALFQALSAEWFERLGLARPLGAALAATPHVRASVGDLRLHRAVRRAHEGSELYRDGAQARLVFGLTPRRFASPDELEEFFLRECLYAEDMLDPEWQYAPELGEGPADDRARAEVLRDRLRVLWQARVRGRLAHLRGDAHESQPPPAFLRAFGEVGEPSAALAALYESVQCGEPADFPSLLAAARAPAAATCVR